MRGRWVLGLVAALAVVALVGVQVAREWDRLPLDAFHLDPAPLALAWLLQTAGWLVVVDTWGRMMHAVGGRAPFGRHVQVYAYTALAHLLPGSYWTPASRVGFYRHLGVGLLPVSATVVLEWLLLGLAGLVLYGATAPFARALPAAFAPKLVVVGVVGLVLLHPSTFARAAGFAAARLRQAGEPPRLAARQIATWFLRELGVLVLSGLAFYLVMVAVSPAASVADALSVSALGVAVSNLLAWLPTTSFIKDGAMVLLLAPVYGSAAVALGVIVVWRLWMVAVQVSWALLVTLVMGRIRPPWAAALAAEPEEEPWTI